jgi:pseudaminic acid cytidylyltransferase
MKRIAIITARGGSKRIPRKNIKSFKGKPIIAYSILAALKSELFDMVMVSTDDKEIADVSIKYGAQVPFFRSALTSDDHATLTDVLIEVLNEYENEGKTFDETCCLLPTAPFIDYRKIIAGFNKLNSDDLTSVIPVKRFSYPIQRALKINKDSLLEMFWPENYRIRSQDFVPAYHDCGQFYCLKTKHMIEEERLYTKRTGLIELGDLEVQDIDNEEDWRLAEIKFDLLKHQGLLDHIA